MNASHDFWVRSLPSGRDEPRPAGWTVTSLARDCPGPMGRLSVYDSVLSEGWQPHPLHDHPEEEIIVLLSGTLDVLTPGEQRRIGPGSFVFHSAFEVHTVRSVGPGPARLLVLKWRAEADLDTAAPSTTLVFDAAAAGEPDPSPGNHRRRLLDARTATVERLRIDHCTIDRRLGFPMHRHDHDVAYVVLAGTLRGVAHTVAAPAVAYYRSGTPHGVREGGDEDLGFLAIEFHRSAGA